MVTKVSFNKMRFLMTCLLFFLCAQSLSAKNVLGRPRRMYLIKTEHFDIIYSKESQETALVLVENADRLYTEAAQTLSSENNLHMPVIISPDSDMLSVDYTSTPYNRIIIFDSPADYQTAVFKDTLLSLFYREIFLALAQSVRSPFNQFISKWVVGEEYQPVALFNLPYSFVEGVAYLAESREDEDASDGLDDAEGRLYDKYFLQILAQAKLEGKFPRWSQVSTVRDTYPGEELALAAGAGFAAFLMSTYGVEKYAQLWQESGKINPLLTQGVFYKTYGIKLKDLWAQFEDSVPLPSGLTDLACLDREGQVLYPKDKEANYEHILLTDFGTVWYDRIRHEVDIYDERNGLKIRQLLFLADNVERMSLSPDGRFISVSNTLSRTMEGLSTSWTWIFDLKERRFLDDKYKLRDASIIKTSDGNFAVAGVNVKNSHAKLEIYTLPSALEETEDEKVKLLASYEFQRNQTPFSPVYSGNGFVTYILADGTDRYLCRRGIEENSEERKWQITTASDSQIKIRRLSYNPSRASENPVYTFEFAMPDIHSFTRFGLISLNKDFEPQEISLLSEDVSGGMNYVVLSPGSPSQPDSDLVYYSAKKYSINQLRTVPLSNLPFEEGQLKEVGLEDVSEPLPSTSLSDYKVRNYNPFKYMADFSFTPFFPLKKINLTEGNLYWPGLGLTIESQTDPCMNTRALLSAGWTYLPLDFTWAKDMPSKYIAKYMKEAKDISKDKSAAFFIENSSTPVYLQAGAIFNCNLKGEYSFNVMAGGQWKLPVGIALRNLIFDLQASYLVSTDYYDQTQRELRPSLSDWPGFDSAYETYQLAIMVEYNNIHQYGYSTFEKRGLDIGVRLYSMWDMVEVKILREARTEKEAKLQQQAQNPENNNSEGNGSDSNNKELTNAQKKNLFSESIADITQLNAGIFATIAIPRLIPLPMINDWVVSMPAVVDIDFVNKAGTALESNFEVLLIGREIHNSIIPALLYSRRAGLWFGYNMALVYDTAETRLPDIRHDNYLAEVFTGVSYAQAFYAILNLDINVMLGKLSSVPINSTLTGTYYPESGGYTITLDFRFHL